jgi:hypothetical protein
VGTQWLGPKVQQPEPGSVDGSTPGVPAHPVPCPPVPAPLVLVPLVLEPLLFAPVRAPPWPAPPFPAPPTPAVPFDPALVLPLPPHPAATSGAHVNARTIAVRMRVVRCMGKALAAEA